MARRFPHSPYDNPRQLFSEARDPSVLSSQFWARLFQYRPLILLGVFWLTLICISAVAYSRLMFSGVPVNSSASAPALTQRSSPPPVIHPAPRSEAGSTAPSPGAIAESFDETQADAADSLNAAAQDRGGFRWKVAGELISLVGLCALGSFLIAQQAKRPPRPKKKRKVMKKTAGKPKPVPKRPSQPKRLAPFAPERDSVVVPGAMTIPENPSDLGSRNAAALAGSFHGASMPPGQARVPQGERSEKDPNAHKRSAAEGIPNRQPVVEQTSDMVPTQPETHNPDIIPDHEDHPLDWTEESIAHSLDLRQKRSLSSFM